MGGIDQLVQYEGIHSLCFACGHVGHKVESCHYKINTPAKEGEKKEVGKARKHQDKTLQRKQEMLLNLGPCFTKKATQ